MRGQPEQQLGAPTRTALGLPVADDVGDDPDGLLAVTEHGGVDEVRDRFGVERGVPTGDHDRVRRVAVHGVQGDAREVERGEQVRVAELGREAHAQQVERADRAVGVDGELRDVVLAQQRLEVRPDGVGPLGQGVGTLVEDLVQDLDALVRQPDLVRVRVHQRPAHARGVPVLRTGVELAAHVLDRLLDLREQRLEPAEDGVARRGGHGARW